MMLQQQILKDKSPFDEEPLYMYLSHQAVHDPLGLPPDDVFSDEEIAILDNILATSDVDGHIRQRFAKVCKPRFYRLPFAIFYNSVGRRFAKV